MTKVRCADCTKAYWHTTHQHSTKGDCQEPLPVLPPAMGFATLKPHRIYIWKDYLGECAYFKPKQPIL